MSTTVAVNGNTLVYEKGSKQNAQTVKNVGATTVYLDSTPTNGNGYPLGAGSSMVWDAGRPLYAYASTGGTLLLLDNSGNLFDASAVASALVSSGLAADIANLSKTNVAMDVLYHGAVVANVLTSIPNFALDNYASVFVNVVPNGTIGRVDFFQAFPLDVGIDYNQTVAQVAVGNASGAYATFPVVQNRLYMQATVAYTITVFGIKDRTLPFQWWDEATLGDGAGFTIYTCTPEVLEFRAVTPSLSLTFPHNAGLTDIATWNVGSNGNIGVYDRETGIYLWNETVPAGTSTRRLMLPPRPLNFFISAAATDMRVIAASIDHKHF